MDLQIANEQALNLLRKASHEKGFLASAIIKDNYQRVWTRDGMITGLAALASREADLVQTFHQTISTLGRHISPQGLVPSNVDVAEKSTSYGGLAGRADTGAWWIIGICLYVKLTGEKDFLKSFESQIEKIHELYHAWEYNSKHLVYVPLAGDWADEYVLHGYVLYDQVLRYAALRLSGQLLERQEWINKSDAVKLAIYENYYINEDWRESGIHQKAKKALLKKSGATAYLPASFHPASYQDYFDALGNSLATIFNTHPDPEKYLDWTLEKFEMAIPAFYPTIEEKDQDFALLKQNFRFEFRNKPNEFHNGGIWPMVNGFWGIAMFLFKGKAEAAEILDKVIAFNSQNSWEFNECFHGITGKACGIPQCTWSAAGQLLLENTLSKGFYLLD